MLDNQQLIIVQMPKFTEHQFLFDVYGRMMQHVFCVKISTFIQIILYFCDDTKFISENSFKVI